MVGVFDVRSRRHLLCWFGCSLDQAYGNYADKNSNLRIITMTVPDFSDSDHAALRIVIIQTKSGSVRDHAVV